MSGAFAFGPARRRRAPSLTPMIDVVFLLLVFFMLAARLGPETVLRLAPGGGAGDWQGPPRLVTVTPDALALNGVPVTADGLAGALGPLMPTPDAPVLLRARDGADLQRLLDAMAALRGAGFKTLVLVE